MSKTIVKSPITVQKLIHEAEALAPNGDAGILAGAFLCLGASDSNIRLRDPEKHLATSTDTCRTDIPRIGWQPC
ncbi:MAG: hypothetical protein NZ483_10525 [Verrucomicrobiae bacterium]|nr:hypothetical protein [Verrucomicrobiae bacterium]